MLFVDVKFVLYNAAVVIEVDTSHVPVMSNVYTGAVVPIPTFPELLNVIAVVPAFTTNSNLLSVLSCIILLT